MTRGKLLTMLVLVMVISLGLSALLTPTGREEALEPARLVPFPPSEVVSVSVESDGAARQLVRTAPDRWEIVLEGDAGAGTIRWPASMERVRGFLRILDRLRAVPASEAPAEAPGTWVRVRGSGGESVSIGLPTSSLGGRSIVRVLAPGASGEGEALVTTDELPRMLAGPGILSWLDSRALAGVQGEITEISITSGGAQMRIARAGSGWRIIAPFQAPADRSLVRELLENLQTLPFTAPLAAPAQEADIRGASTTITLTAESRSVGPDGAVSTQTTSHTVSLLASAGAGGLHRASVIAERRPAEGSPAVLAGPLSVELDGDRLASHVRQPAFYLARRTLEAAPGDIRGFRFARGPGEDRRWTRTDLGWSAGGKPLPAEAAAALNGLAALLTETPAPVAAWVGESGPRDADQLAIIDCLGLGDASIARVALAFGPLPSAGAEGRAHAVLIHEGVARYYTRESTVETMNWLLGPGSAE